MIGDFFKAVGQLGDPRFRRVFGLSIGGTLLILALLYAGWGALASSLGSPEDFTLLGYDLGLLDSVLEVLAWLAGLFALSFLMMPVAALFIGFFLEEIADAVEARHYPHARGTRKSSWGEIAQDGMLFTMTLIGANLAAVILYLIVPPLGPFIFLGVNGFFLGRQYFELVAARHVTFEEARALRAKVEAGEDFGTLAVAHTEDLTRRYTEARGEAVGVEFLTAFGTGAMGNPLNELCRTLKESYYTRLVDGVSAVFNAVAELRDGDVSEPWRTPLGYVLVEMRGAQLAVLEREFEDAEFQTRSYHRDASFVTWAKDVLGGVEPEVIQAN